MRLKFWTVMMMGAISGIVAIRYCNYERSTDQYDDVFVVPEVLNNKQLLEKPVASDVDIEGVETVSQLALDKKFMLESRDIRTAGQIERQISHKFTKNRQFREIEV